MTEIQKKLGLSLRTSMRELSRKASAVDRAGNLKEDNMPHSPFLSVKSKSSPNSTY